MEKRRKLWYDIILESLKGMSDVIIGDHELRRRSSYESYVSAIEISFRTAPSPRKSFFRRLIDAGYSDEPGKPLLTLGETKKALERNNIIKSYKPYPKFEPGEEPLTTLTYIEPLYSDGISFHAGGIVYVTTMQNFVNAVVRSIK